MKPKVKKTNWYGFDHKKVAKQFGGDLSFCNYFCVNGEYQPVAVYKAKNPDKSKGHKKFMLLQLQSNNQGLVRGMTTSEIKKWRYQDAVLCLKCNTIIYSIMRHHNESCECGAVSIDGAKDYTKLSYKERTAYLPVTLDLLTDKIK
jgi:hypothetical protein